jgi:hypothetical protein
MLHSTPDFGFDVLFVTIMRCHTFGQQRQSGAPCRTWPGPVSTSGVPPSDGSMSNKPNLGRAGGSARVDRAEQSQFAAGGSGAILQNKAKLGMGGVFGQGHCMRDGSCGGWKAPNKANLRRTAGGTVCTNKANFPPPVPETPAGAIMPNKANLRRRRYPSNPVFYHSTVPARGGLCGTWR